MVLAKANLHGNIGDEKIEYQFAIDTGHVENTTEPNLVSYSFQIPPGLLQQGYIIDGFNFIESYRVGNCYFNHKSSSDTLQVDAIAKAVKHSLGWWYAKGGWLKGTVIVTLKKTKYLPEIQSNLLSENSQSTLDMKYSSINLVINEKGGQQNMNMENRTINIDGGDYQETHRDYYENVGRDKIRKVEGDIINAIASKTDLAEAAEEIQKLLDQLSKTYPSEEIENKAAENLANRAKQDFSFREKLKKWSQSLLNKGSETAVTEAVKEGVKRVIPLAITMLV